MTSCQKSQKNKSKPTALALTTLFIATFSACSFSVAYAAGMATNAVASNPEQQPTAMVADKPTGMTSPPTILAPTDTVTSNVNAPLTEPNMSDSAVLTYATDAAKSAYSYDFKNYNKQMQMNQQYFTGPGWTAFMNALDKSNNLKVVESKKLVASATTTAKPAIVNKGIKNGVYTWKVVVPVLATYENETKLIKQSLLITMLINRNNSPSGVGISHFVAEVVPAQPMTITSPSTVTSAPVTGTTTTVTTPSTTTGPMTPSTSGGVTGSGTTPPVITSPSTTGTPGGLNTPSTTGTTSGTTTSPSTTGTISPTTGTTGITTPSTGTTTPATTTPGGSTTRTTGTTGPTGLGGTTTGIPGASSGTTSTPGTSQ
ncbi:MAG: DotI/IcmL/TraM family protein [Gammaproteobacteria bacterium]|nr:DotI/IcmL/TraM family protein [Gammaproteobacteria bacterium]